MNFRGLSLGVGVIALSALIISAQVPPSVQPLLILRQPATLGGGAALAANGETMVYVASDKALRVRNVAAGDERVIVSLIASTRPPLDVFNDPCFANGDSSVIFSAGGGTVYYPSEIFSVNTDGSGLVQLTRSSEARIAGKVTEAFYRPICSPAGDQVMVWHHEPPGNESSSRESALLLALDGTKRQTVANARPLAWSANGLAVFVARNDAVVKVDLGTGREQSVQHLSEPILGRFPGRDVFAVVDDSTVGFAFVDEAFAAEPIPSPFPVRKTLGNARPARAVTLVSVHFDKAGDRALLHYRGSVEETFELYDIYNLPR